VVGTLPVLAFAVEVPHPAHPHVGVQDDAVVPLDLEVLAVALDRLDEPPGGGRDPRLAPDLHRSAILSVMAPVEAHGDRMAAVGLNN